MKFKISYLLYCICHALFSKEVFFRSLLFYQDQLSWLKNLEGPFFCPVYTFEIAWITKHCLGSELTWQQGPCRNICLTEETLTSLIYQLS